MVWNEAHTDAYVRRRRQSVDVLSHRDGALMLTLSELGATESAAFVAATVSAVIAEVSGAGGSRLGLNVFEWNAEAVNLYRSLGFERLSASSGGDEMWLRLDAPR